MCVQEGPTRASAAAALRRGVGVPHGAMVLLWCGAAAVRAGMAPLCGSGPPGYASALRLLMGWRAACERLCRERAAGPPKAAFLSPRAQRGGASAGPPAPRCGGTRCVAMSVQRIAARRLCGVRQGAM